MCVCVCVCVCVCGCGCVCVCVEGGLQNLVGSVFTQIFVVVVVVVFIVHETMHTLTLGNCSYTDGVSARFLLSYSLVRALAPNF